MKRRFAEYQRTASRQSLPTITKLSTTDGLATWHLIAVSLLFGSRHMTPFLSFFRLPCSFYLSLGNGLSLPCSTFCRVRCSAYTLNWVDRQVEESCICSPPGHISMGTARGSLYIVLLEDLWLQFLFHIYVSCWSKPFLRNASYILEHKGYWELWNTMGLYENIPLHIWLPELNLTEIYYSTM